MQLKLTKKFEKAYLWKREILASEYTILLHSSCILFYSCPDWTFCRRNPPKRYSCDSERLHQQNKRMSRSKEKNTL